MSTDYHLICQYKENDVWKPLKFNGEIWESNYWGVSSIKSSFFIQNENFCNAEIISDDIFKNWDYCEFWEVLSLKLNFSYCEAEDIDINIEFLKEIKDIINSLKGKEYMFLVRWC